jgi:Cu(I)/Ag(I) efflux system membrane fusion protein
MRPNPRSLALVGIGVVMGLAIAAVIYGVSGLRERDSGSAAAPAGAVWTCSMHPQIRMSRPGRCPICGMELVPVQAEGTAGAGTAGPPPRT